MNNQGSPSAADLQTQAELATQLAVILDRCRALADGLPKIEDLEHLAQLAGGLQYELSEIRDLWASGTLPRLDELHQFEQVVGATLRALKDTATALGLPSNDELAEFTRGHLR
ncbi:MAG: hypothetical protein K1X74_14195 [Pirellulales bacterium]|nr:hypothetical protein [Pirellulales bacterium]